MLHQAFSKAFLSTAACSSILLLASCCGSNKDAGPAGLRCGGSYRDSAPPELEGEVVLSGHVIATSDDLWIGADGGIFRWPKASNESPELLVKHVQFLGPFEAENAVYLQAETGLFRWRKGTDPALVPIRWPGSPTRWKFPITPLWIDETPEHDWMIASNGLLRFKRGSYSAPDWEQPNGYPSVGGPMGRSSLPGTPPWSSATAVRVESPAGHDYVWISSREGVFRWKKRVAEGPVFVRELPSSVRFVEETTSHAWLGVTSGQLYYWKKGTEEDLVEVPGPQDPYRVLAVESGTYILARNGLFEWKKGEDPRIVFSFGETEQAEIFETEKNLYVMAEDVAYLFRKHALQQPEVFELPKVEYPRNEETRSYFWLKRENTLYSWKKDAEEGPVVVPGVDPGERGFDVQELPGNVWISSGRGISRWDSDDPGPPTNLDLPDMIDLANGMTQFRVMATSDYIWISVAEMELDSDIAVARRRWLLSFERGRPEEIRIRGFPFGHLHEVFQVSSGFWLHTSEGLVRISAEASPFSRASATRSPPRSGRAPRPLRDPPAPASGSVPKTAPLMRDRSVNGDEKTCSIN